MPHLKLDLLLPSLGVTQFHRQRAIVDQLVFCKVNALKNKKNTYVVLGLGQLI